MVPLVNINYIAVLVAAVVGMGLGFLWYSKTLFGNIWIKLMGFDMSANRSRMRGSQDSLANSPISEHARKPKVFDKKKMSEAKKKGMGKTFAFAFLSTLLMSYVLAHFVDYTQASTAMDGVVAGFWLWLGFLATTQLGSVIWEGKPFKLYLINTLHYLVTLAVMGAILAVWV